MSNSSYADGQTSDSLWGNAAGRTSWTQDLLGGMVAGAVAGTLAVPVFGTAMGAVGGLAGGAAKHLFQGLFDDGPAPQPAPASKPAAAAAKPPAARTLDQELEAEAERRGDFKAAAGALIKKDYLQPGEAKAQADRDKAIDLRLDDGKNPAEDKKSRLALMNKLTQNDGSDPAKEKQCGAAALLGSILYASGKDGLGSVIDGLQQGQKTKDPELQDLQKKIKSGAINLDDFQLLQGKLYDKLHQAQAVGSDGKPVDGLTKRSMDGFLAANPALAKQMKDSGVAIRNIDNDGDKKVNHYVVDIQDKAAGTDRAVYDPYARKGGQVVTDRAHLRLYDSPMSVDVTNPTT